MTVTGNADEQARYVLLVIMTAGLFTWPGAKVVLLPCCCRFLESVRCSGLRGSGLRIRPVLALLDSLKAVFASFGGEPGVNPT